MTWTLKASGHHSTSNWEDEEYALLAEFVKATEVEDTITSNFEFNGNHVQATSLADAREKLAARDASPA